MYPGKKIWTGGLYSVKLIWEGLVHYPGFSNYGPVWPKCDRTRYRVPSWVIPRYIVRLERAYIVLPQFAMAYVGRIFDHRIITGESGGMFQSVFRVVSTSEITRCTMWYRCRLLGEWLAFMVITICFILCKVPLNKSKFNTCWTLLWTDVHNNGRTSTRKDVHK